MSAKKLYDRLVGKLMAHWMKLYPMCEWVDPEGAADRIVAELLDLRKLRDETENHLYTKQDIDRLREFAKVCK